MRTHVWNLTQRDLFTGKENTMTLMVEKEDYDRWHQHARPFIQDCFPYLSADEREFILTGTMPDSWDAAFKEGDG